MNRNITGTITIDKTKKTTSRRIVTAADYTPADIQPEAKMLYTTAANQRPLTPFEKLAQQTALKRYHRPY